MNHDTSTHAAILGAAAIVSFLPAIALAAPAPTTPIEHVIVVVGENRTFDNLFATYQPQKGETVWNLLSKKIVRKDGSPGPNFHLAAQNKAVNTGAFSAMPQPAGSYETLPQPYAAGAIGQRRDVPDARFPSDLPNGPFQITRHVSYGAHTGDPVHRFFQMWQQVNGGKNDLFVWTAETVGVGPSNGHPALGPGRTFQGGVAMGFYNMAAGDAAYFKQLADRYAISDNYHQPVMGGTTANYFALATADVGFYTQDGKPAIPPANQIENPDILPGTNNWYTDDGYKGGTYVNCADLSAPGVAGIREVLAKQPYRPFNDGNCAPGTYYMVNNLDPAFTAQGKELPLGKDKFLLPPQTIPNIGDSLTAAGIPWKWYSGGRNDGITVDKEYCAMCDTLSFFSSTMKGPDREKLQDLQQFYVDVKGARHFPAVSVIAPYDSISGHPGYAMQTGFDELVRDIVERVQANPALWKKTAILVTFDEGGGYYDSGYVQLIDFFGDGTRIPMIAISPFAKRGHVDHTYYNHASILKFIQRNWGLSPLSDRSRDNLPNPVHEAGNPYIPSNRPAVGDLMNMFDFARASSKQSNK
ncbi:MAG: alkaline phosphatase family protein [Sulfurimicrobium sp.]|nr:alkaline phosphatase family protein [Sulfurimicrobium sp.]MDP1705415.1 alkaline phosphatase family protein [Sulfurimicrobium sp.]MDP2198724.1 alkaline phosphatase family protein [Sulfurimicrobium sp.]MDP3686542.1 alkaline phosphatase family protein [Sulfurimicrobium sp.]MDZ7656173.1 alkaline phosphatase family protein [Sulfurimicrobium sp.]